MEDELYWQKCKELISTLPRHIKVTYKGRLDAAQAREIAKDYDLKLFYNSCLIYMTANVKEMREKGLLKFLKEEDRINLHRIMELNNIK